MRKGWEYWNTGRFLNVYKVQLPPAAAATAAADICICNNNNNNNNKHKYKYTSISRSIVIVGTPKSNISFPRYSAIPNNCNTNPNSQMACSSGKAKEEKAGVGEFHLPTGALLKVNKGDITCWSVDATSDAIVNPANERMLGGRGADGAIHSAAGPELVKACYKVPEVQPGVRCPTGQARITPGFKLPASHVIHTVGPVYDTDSNPQASLTNAYRNSLAVAKDNNIHYIAFPAISCGAFRYPYEEAATVAISTVKEFADNLKEVHFVLFSDEMYDVWLKKAEELLQS